MKDLNKLREAVADEQGTEAMYEILNTVQESVSMEGVLGQMMGGATDTITLKNFRAQSKVYAANTNTKKLKAITNEMLDDIVKYIEQQTKEHNIKTIKTDSWMATIGNNVPIWVTILTDEMYEEFKEELTASRSGLNTFGRATMLVGEKFNGKKTREILRKQGDTPKKLADMVKLYKKRNNELLDLTDVDGEQPMIGNTHFVTQGVVRLASLIRSTVRRSI